MEGHCYWTTASNEVLLKRQVLLALCKAVKASISSATAWENQSTFDL